MVYSYYYHTLAAAISQNYILAQDRYAVQQALPPIDARQDWFLVSGEEAGGYTILEFTRNWTTCDDRDRNILV